MNKKIWTIDYYENLSRRPVEDFTNNLNEKTQAKVYYLMEYLTEFGTTAGYPHTKKISGTKMWEARTSGKHPVRFFYVTKKGRRLVMLHGFIKKTQKTPRKEIKIALKRLEEINY